MSSGFVTEAEAAELRKRRQEEWETVRKASDPIERPEEPYDNRSLFDRLQEQKQKRDLEYEEAHKLKNMIKTLDDDEVEFLDVIDRVKLAAERKKAQEEEKELNDYRNRVQLLQEKSVDERLQAEKLINKPKVTSNKSVSLQKLLKGVVVKKTDAVKRKMSSPCGHKDSENSDENGSKHQKITGGIECETTESSSSGVDNSLRNEDVGGILSPTNGVLKCVAILPGLGCYNDSSSDENSSDSSQETITEEPRRDLTGRLVQCIELGKKTGRQPQ